jgi:hypothetical protein
LPQSSIRGVELNGQFLALKCVNLEHNQLTNFSGLIHLTNLKVIRAIVFTVTTSTSERF